MQTVKSFSFDGQNAMIFVENQEEPVVIQPFHPNGQAWASSEDAIAWAKQYAIDVFRYVEPEITLEEPEVIESPESGTSEITAETAE